MKNCFRSAALPLCLLLLLCAVSPGALAAEQPPEPDYAGLPEGLADTLSLPDELLQTLQDADLSGLLEDLKPLASESAAMSDDELDAALDTIARSHGISLVPEQLHQLRALCRALEKLNAQELNTALETLRQKADALLSGTDEAKAAPLRAALQALAALLQRLAGWVRRLLDGLAALLSH